MKTRSYRQLISFSTFEERYKYLRLEGIIGESTFGFSRYINQQLYKSREWKRIRDLIIIRDGGCDLGVSGCDIHGQIIIHHINPITLEDIEAGEFCIFNPNNLITTSLNTHNAIHYGNMSALIQLPKDRKPNDTCLWTRY